MVKQTKTRSGPGVSKTRRTVQAEQTKAEILTVARRRFAAEGYAATTLRDIAAEAGVSVQTVFNSVGSKGDLVRQLNDLIDDEAGIGELAASVRDETDVSALVVLPARITRRILERCGDIVRTSFDAARTEKGLGEVAAEGGRRHRAGAAAVAARLASLGALAPNIDEQHAATTLAALSETRLALVMLDDYGLDLDAVETWMSRTAKQVLLAH
ncbi:MAG: helix-turn-helix domain-containing protein [Jiangellaceae bacterium]